MSLACSVHGWDLGEVGCHECHEKNANPWGRATVNMYDLSRAVKEMNAAIRLSYGVLVSKPSDFPVNI